MTTTANIKTFRRPKCLDRCLDACRIAGIRKVIVTFDGEDSILPEVNIIIDKYKDEFDNLNYIRMPFNVGISKCRNRMIKETKTKYLLSLDDDVYPPKDVLEIEKFMDRHENIGGTCFGWVMDTNNNNRVQLDCCNIFIYNNMLVRVPPLDFNSEFIDGHMYWYPFNFIYNTGIYRKKSFEMIKWDERFVVWEHDDLFLRHELLGKWKFAGCPTMYGYHDHTTPPTDSRRKGVRRDMESEGWKKFSKKWNVKGCVFKGLNPKIFDSRYCTKAYLNLMIQSGILKVDYD